jgi:hypothetical protein
MVRYEVIVQPGHDAESEFVLLTDHRLSEGSSFETSDGSSYAVVAERLDSGPEDWLARGTLNVKLLWQHGLSAAAQ